MARDIQLIDDDVTKLKDFRTKLEAKLGFAALPGQPDVATRLDQINGIKTSLGTLPQGKDVATRLKDLEALTTTHAQKLERFKVYTWGIIGFLAANATLIKLDIQAFKFDFTLFKKMDEKNIGFLKKWHKNTDRVLERTRFAFRKEALEERRAAAERAKKDKAEQERKDARLQRQINALPPVVNKHTRQIKAIQGTLRNARLAAQQVRGNTPDRRGGLDAATPRLGPVTKDVKDLRSAVDQLARSLGAF